MAVLTKKTAAKQDDAPAADAPATEAPKVKKLVQLKVKLLDVVLINGVKYGPGDAFLPEDAFHAARAVLDENAGVQVVETILPDEDAAQ